MNYTYSICIQYHFIRILLCLLRVKRLIIFYIEENKKKKKFKYLLDFFPEINLHYIKRV